MNASRLTITKLIVADIDAFAADPEGRLIQLLQGSVD